MEGGQFIHGGNWCLGYLLQKCVYYVLRSLNNICAILNCIPHLITSARRSHIATLSCVNYFVPWQPYKSKAPPGQYH